MGNHQQIQKRITQKQQAAATPKLHPRGLARSIAKHMKAGKAWRTAVASLPATGRRKLLPERKGARK